MTRVVIRLRNDISTIIPVLAREIPGCAYGPRVPIVSFRYNNWRVVVEKDEITVLDVENDQSGKQLIDYLTDILEDTHHKHDM